MFKRILCASLLVLGMAPNAPPAEAQVICMPRDELVTFLTQRYGEARKGFGIRDPKSLLEIWTSSETGSWSVFMTNSKGESCVIATGQHWQDEGPALPALGKPASVVGPARFR